MSQAIEERVRGIIADQLGVAEEEIKPESKFIEDLAFGPTVVPTSEMALHQRRTARPLGDFEPSGLWGT